MHSFVATNAVISKVYGDVNHNVYGEPSILNYVDTAYKVGFCHVSEQQRIYSGDTYKHDAVACGIRVASLAEGVVIEITMDNGDEAKLWRIENLELAESLPFVTSRIRTMLLGLSEYTK